jgi:hypothetical protein
VGIGTASPVSGSKVDVNGIITSSSSSKYLNLGWSGSNAYIQTTDASSNGYNLIFYGGASERMRVNAYGIGIGGTTPSSGTGITFPATASPSSNANTLDDYEEGTWTPVMNSTNQQTGVYVKIGRSVTIAVDLSASYTGGSTYVISGLPFSPQTNCQYAGINVYSSLGSASGPLVVTTGVIHIYNLGTSQTNLPSGGRIIFTVTYLADA